MSFTFQSIMNKIFYDRNGEFMFSYIDDLLISSKDEKNHLNHTETVLKGLKECELFVTSNKYTFLQKEMNFLGLFLFSMNGIKVKAKKVEGLKT